MMAPTHKIVGGTTAFVVTTAVGLPVEFVVASSVGAAMGSSLPDDVEKLLHIRPHRQNLTHYPFAQLVFFALIAVAGAVYAPAFASLIAFACVSLAFACVMHSVADSLTVEKGGIRLLWPISRRGYHLMPWSMRIWVGSKSRSEKVFVVVWLLAVLIYTYAHFGSLIYA